MPHKFDLSAFITKTTEENNNNKLVIQLTITDINHIMAYAWNNSQAQQQPGSELTWEEQNFMEEEQQKQQQQAVVAKPDFSEYEWMVNSDEFDSQAMQQIEQDDDDLDDMFYWDPSKGCTKGKSTVKKEQTQTENNNHNNNGSLFQNFTHNQQFQNFQSFQSVQNNNNNDLKQQSDKKSFITNPFSSNFQNNPEMNYHASSQNFNNNNNINQEQQQKNTNSNIPGGDDLARAMGGVNLNKFHLNPEATTFVPSWLKK